MTESDVDAADLPPNESEIDKVRAAADFVVSAEASADDTVTSLQEWLAAHPS